MSELTELSWNKKLEILRIIKNWTQMQAAKECNTSQKMFWSWENGINYPRKNSRISIAKAFNVKVEQIF
jgi:DNA-binding XRE family transcriptional regulator